MLTLKISCTPGRAQDIAEAFDNQEIVTVEYDYTDDGLEVRPFFPEHGAAFLMLVGKLAHIIS